MATKYVQIPSGQPYCFSCNTSFRSLFSLNRHNVAFRARHEEIEATREVLRGADTDDPVAVLRPRSSALRVNSVDLLHEIAKPLCCTVSKTPSGATSQVAACEADDQATAKGTAPLPSKEERLEKYAKQGFIVRKKSTTSHGDSTRAEERQPPHEEKATAIKKTHKRPANKDHTERSATDESAKRNKNCEVQSRKSSAERNDFPRFPAGKCEPRLEQRDDHWRMTARFGGQPMRRPGGGRGFTNGGRRQRDRGPTVRSTSWLSACKRW